MKKGYAAILLVFLIGLVGLFLSLTLMATGFVESNNGRELTLGDQAFFTAQSGVEEAIYKINTIADYGVLSPQTFTLPIETGEANVTVTGTAKERNITSIGSFGRYVSRIESTVVNTSVIPGFLYAIHAGSGGIALRNNTVIIGKDNTDGNVYSNANIHGAKNDFFVATGLCKNSASAIKGSAWAVGMFDKLASQDSGVCVEKNAEANEFLYCSIGGNAEGPNSPSANCPLRGSYTNQVAPTPIPLPDMDIETMKEFLTKHDEVWAGNCIADGTNSPSDCTKGTGELGTIIIDGNLTTVQNTPLDFGGPVWVKGTLTFASNGSVGLTQAITDVGQIILADKGIISNSNVSFESQGTAFLLFISEYDPRTLNPSLTDLCTDPSIAISSNTNSVLFYATSGCVTITANSNFHGAVLGEKINVDNNGIIEYDPLLSAAVFGLTESGGWQTRVFRQF